MGGTPLSPGERYALVLRVPRQQEVSIEDAYLGLAGLTKPVASYHITLVGPFHFRSALSKEIEDILGTACSRWEPFDVRIRGLGAFEKPGDHLVYLGVTNEEQVVALRGFLLKQLLPHLTPENERVAQFTLASYHPHVTLGLGLSDAELRAILGATIRRPVDLSFRADCVWLMSQAGSAPWRYVRSFALGGEAAAPCSLDHH